MSMKENGIFGLCPYLFPMCTGFTFSYLVVFAVVVVYVKPLMC